jgi:hypothetical protein
MGLTKTDKQPSIHAFFKDLQKFNEEIGISSHKQMILLSYVYENDLESFTPSDLIYWTGMPKVTTYRFCQNFCDNGLFTDLGKKVSKPVTTGIDNRSRLLRVDKKSKVWKSFKALALSM